MLLFKKIDLLSDINSINLKNEIVMIIESIDK